MLGEINRINLVTACSFCNSMTSRMKDISADGILPPEDFEEATSINAKPVQDMLRRLQEHVDKVQPTKRRYVQKRLAELRKTFEADVKPKLQEARKRPEVKNEVLTAMDQFEKRLRSCRAYFPYTPAALIGQQEFETAPLYQNCGHPVAFKFTEPLTEGDIDRINAIGNFINQSYVVFLCSVLEFHHVLVYKEEIDKKLDGAEHVDLLRHLRNVIAHGVGEYRPLDLDHKRLYEKLQEVYKVDPEGDPKNAQAFPLPIDQVLLPMTKGCRAYAEALRQHRAVPEKLADIPDTEERVIVATGRYLGEGFDDARLDTLFLTMPISWKGTLAQYAGRLHRLHSGKKEVCIYDYADLNVPMLARMHEKRLKGYRAIGYVQSAPTEQH